MPAYLYAGSLEGQLIYGIGATGTPWRNAEARFDYVHVEDSNDYYGTPILDEFEGELSQRIGEYGHGRVYYQQQGDTPTYAGVTYDTFTASMDTSFHGKFHSQLESQKAQVYSVDPYFAITETLEPYWDALISASKCFGEHVSVEGGGNVRHLWDSADQGQFNREYERVWATVNAANWPSRNWSAWVTGDWYAGDDQVGAFGVGVEWKPTKCWRWTAGTDYQLWRTNFYTSTDDYDSRLFYVRGWYTPNDRWRFDTSIQVEDDKMDTFLTFWLGVRFTF